MLTFGVVLSYQRTTASQVGEKLQMPQKPIERA